MAPERASAQEKLAKEHCSGQERGQGRAFIGRCCISVCASDFSPKEKNWGSHLRDHLCQLC